MKNFLIVSALLVFFTDLTPALLWAAPPNVVLSRALHFSSPDGVSITLDPGKYFIEQAGPSELRLTPEGGKPSVTIQATSLTHEQYELFSPMALTRPQKDGYLVELLLPGGIRLEAKGFMNAPAETSKQAQAPAPAPQPAIIPEPPLAESPPVPDSHQAQEENPASAVAFPNTPHVENFLSYHGPDLPTQKLRVVVDNHESGKEPLYLSVISPNHIGLTMFEQPALFWFIAQPTSQPVDIQIIEEENAQTLLDVRMLPPIRPGIHKVDLSDYGIRLQPNRTYQWTITLGGNTHAEDAISSGWIMRIPPPEIVAAVAHLPSITSIPPRSLVEAGLWYDAIWDLSERIQAHPTDITALNQRALLFEQVDLFGPAQHDLAHLPSP